MEVYRERALAAFGCLWLPLGASGCPRAASERLWLAIWLPLAASGYISGCFWTASGCHWVASWVRLAACGCLWLPLVASGRVWLKQSGGLLISCLCLEIRMPLDAYCCSMAAPGCFVIASGCLWLPLSAPGCAWLFLALLLAASGAPQYPTASRGTQRYPPPHCVAFFAW